MKFLSGVLALTALCVAEPEADPYGLYYPLVRPYYASGYAGPLPSGYQAVSRLHRREADPQLLLAANTIPSLFAPSVGAVFNAPVVKSVVETPAVVSHTVQAAPLPLAAAPLTFPAATPFALRAAAPLAVAAPATAAVALGPHDCVTEGGCALKAALATGLPTASVGSTSILGRKRREAEAEAEAETEAEADALYYSAYPYGLGAYAYSPYSYSASPLYAPGYAAYASPYSAYAAPYSAYAPYYANPYYYSAPLAAEVAPVAVEAAPVAHVAPVAPVVVKAAPVVETVSKPVTYTHLGAHPIQPTTVLETKSTLLV